MIAKARRSANLGASNARLTGLASLHLDPEPPLHDPAAAFAAAPAAIN